MTTEIEIKFSHILFFYLLLNLSSDLLNFFTFVGEDSSGQGFLDVLDSGSLGKLARFWVLRSLSGVLHQVLPWSVNCLVLANQVVCSNLIYYYTRPTAFKEKRSGSRGDFLTIPRHGLNLHFFFMSNFRR